MFASWKRCYICKNDCESTSQFKQSFTYGCYKRNKKGLDLVLLAEAYAKSGAVRSADKSNPTISIQTFLEKVKDIPEFTKRIPILVSLELMPEK